MSKYLHFGEKDFPRELLVAKLFWENNSKRPVDALAQKTLMTHSLTDNLKSRDASASKKED